MTSLFAPVIDLLWDEKLKPYIDEKFDEFTDKVLAVLPIMLGATAKEILERDPDIPGLSDVFDLSETIRQVVNRETPVGVRIPGFDDLADLFNREPK